METSDSTPSDEWQVPQPSPHGFATWPTWLRLLVPALAGLLVIVSAALAIGASRGSSGLATHDISGTLTLMQPLAVGDLNYVVTGPRQEGCYTIADGYSDIAVGAPVVIKNAAGTIISTTQLQSGRSVESPRLGCAFDWLAKAVPDSPFYTITVSHRGDLSYSRQELARLKWSAATTLGNT